MVPPKAYQAAESVQSLFRMLSPYLRSSVDCKLLSTLVEASDCREAIDKLNAFLGKRNDSASSITLQGLQDYTLPPAHVHVALDRGSHPLTPPAASMPMDSFQPPPVLQGLQEDYTLPPAHVHVALERGSHPLTPSMPVDSFQPSHALQGLQDDYTLPPAHVHVALERGSHLLTLPPASMPVDSSHLPAPTVPVMSSQPRLPVHVKLKDNVLNLREYDRIASAVCRTLQTPRLSLHLCGIGRKYTLQWEMSADLESYLWTVQPAASDVQALAEAGVTELTVGTFLHLHVEVRVVVA